MTKYLNVVLHERVERFPSEALRQLLGADGPIAELQFVKDALQGQRHTALRVVTLRRHLVDSFAQLRQRINIYRYRYTNQLNRQLT